MSDIVFRAGPCLDVFGAEPDNSFDCFVSDWPAGVAFMSRAWDRDHGGRDAWIKVWSEVAAMMHDKAKPGAYSLTWALPRTAHWTACALEDGGWFIQDVVQHVFGQGWPKGRSALKPASECWILARKGSGGALQIDAARVARGARPEMVRTEALGTSNARSGPSLGGTTSGDTTTLGSWPPNLCLSHHPECEERGTRKVTSGNAKEDRRPLGQSMFGPTHHNGVHFGDASGSENVPAFDCLAACDCGASVLAPSGGEPPRCACGRAMWWCCPVAIMDAQSGQSASTTHARGSGGFWGAATSERGVVGPADSGGASRFFPRFTWIDVSGSTSRTDPAPRAASCARSSRTGSVCGEASSAGASPRHGGDRAPSASSLPGSQDGCPSCPRSDGERSPSGEVDARGAAPSLPDAHGGDLPPASSPARTHPGQPCDPSKAGEPLPCVPPSSMLASRTCVALTQREPRAPAARSVRTEQPEPPPISPRDSTLASNMGLSPGTTGTTSCSASTCVPSANDATKSTLVQVDLRDVMRFVYAAKAAGGERHAGCDGLLWRADKRSPFGFARIGQAEYDALNSGTHETIRAGRRDDQQPARARGNVHPTVKSLALMEWLVALVCPPGGRVGDVTCGSGGTGLAVERLNVSRSLGASFLGCDICPEAIEIAQARLAWWRANTAVQTGLFGEATVIEAEAKRPAPPKEKSAPTAPAVDPRQRSFFDP